MPQITDTDSILEMPTTYFVFEQQTEKEITHPQTIEQQEKQNCCNFWMGRKRT
jgi:hypothetical protein